MVFGCFAGAGEQALCLAVSQVPQDEALGA